MSVRGFWKKLLGEGKLRGNGGVEWEWDQLMDEVVDEVVDMVEDNTMMVGDKMMDGTEGGNFVIVAGNQIEIPGLAEGGRGEQSLRGDSNEQARF
jgi:hypothetical protein